MKPFKEIFNGVGLNYSPTQVEQVLQLLQLYECHDAITQGVLDNPKPKLIDGIAKHTHQLLVFTAYLQSTLLRPSHLELIDLKDPGNLEFKALKKCVGALGMIDEIKPKFKIYPSVIVLGAIQILVESRMRHFIRLVQSGEITDVKHLLLSVGDRVLDNFETTKSEGAKTESDMAKLVVQKLMEEFPAVFENITVDYNNAQKKPDSTRARTDDAAEDTAKMYRQKTPVLIISNQPFCQYQQETHRVPFHPTPVETIGEEASDEYNGWDYCDSFSRFMYCITRRHLVLDCGMDAARADKIINEYKKEYRCDSSLYFEGKLRDELLVR